MVVDDVLILKRIFRLVYRSYKIAMLSENIDCDHLHTTEKRKKKNYANRAHLNGVADVMDVLIGRNSITFVFFLNIRMCGTEIGLTVGYSTNETNTHIYRFDTIFVVIVVVDPIDISHSLKHYRKLISTLIDLFN